MPTGYTAAIADGIPFETFVWNCARAFGALIEMRDEPPGARIPDMFEPPSYYANALAEANSELSALAGMTDAEAEIAAADKFRTALAAHRKYTDDRTTLLAQYQAMRSQVESWSPPTPDHEMLRTFMADQIAESIRFDCSVSLDLPVRMAGAEWRTERIARLEADRERYVKREAEERARTDEHNAWVRALRESVPQPAVAVST